MERSKILIVDEDAAFRKFCAETLTRAGFEVRTASGDDDIMKICAEEPIAMIIADIFLPQKSGIEILEEVKSAFPSLDVVVSTGYASVETAVIALKKGASDYLRKPLAPEELTSAVGNILAQRKLYQDNEELKIQLRLYELSRSFTAVEEPARVAVLGLDALREISGAKAGLCVMLDDDTKKHVLRSARNLTADEKNRAEELLPFWTENKHVAGGKPKVLEGEDFERIFGALSPGRYDKALVMPLRSGGGSHGFFALLEGPESGPFVRRVLDGIDFLSGQIAIAFKAAARLQAAKGLAFVDSLTDLYNARYLNIILEKRMAEARESDRPLSILFIDLDNFKNVNTMFGHLAGSKTLIEVGWILESNVRGGDTVIRYGGDEFTIVLPNTDTESAREIAERIRKTVAEHVFLGRENKTVRLTACFGLATFPKDAETAELLINLADQAMYRGKRTTRNVVISAGSEKSDEL